MMALVLWMLGYPDQAVQRSQEALTLAHALAHPYSLAYTLFVSAVLRRYRREWQMAQAHAEAALALATEHGFARYVALGAVLQGVVRAMQAQGETSMAQMCQGLAAVRGMDQTELQRSSLIMRAEVAEHAGEVEEGLALVAEALRALEANGQGDLLAEAYRLKGAFLLRQPVPDASAAEACFQWALDVARRQQAKAWELRAATSLARLWQQHGKRTAAYELLAPVYGWFTEGFDTADLQEAKALLDALA